MIKNFLKHCLWIHLFAFCACGGGDALTEISDDSAESEDESIYDLSLDIDAGYPVAESDFIISSPFGPRLKASDDYRYDFHRGIDIPGSEGDPIYAVTTGTLHAAYPENSSAYPDGGNVVVIEHNLAAPITFHDQSITPFYTVYLHLKDFGSAATNYIATGTQEEIAAGEIIGSMGSTGDTDFTHLHFELRLSTPCSLEYQNAHPDSECSGFGFDPHINPLALYPNDFTDSEQSISLVSGSASAVTIQITGAPEALIVDGLTLALYDSENFDNVLSSQTVSFNWRESFDATSTASLDENDTETLIISPDVFNTSSTSYEIEFEFTLDSSLSEDRTELYLRATLLNTFGPDSTVSGRLSLE